MCCSAACAFQPIAPSLNQNSSSALPLLPCRHPVINHCHPIWHPRRGLQAVLSRFSTNQGRPHRPELQLSTSPTPTHTSFNTPTSAPNPDNDHSNHRHQGNLRNWHACRDRCRPQTRPSRQSSSAVPLPHSFSLASRSTSTSHLGKS